MKGERMRTSERILQEVKKAVIGKDELLEKILMAILANGHILMEDMPGGWGKQQSHERLRMRCSWIAGECNLQWMYYRQMLPALV